MIVFKNIIKAWNGVCVLNNISMHVLRQSVHCLVGPSGSGKSVMLKHAAGLLMPDSGHVLVEGIDVASLRTHADFCALYDVCQMVAQSPTLFDHLTVFENVLLGFGAVCLKTTPEDSYACERALCDVGCETFIKKYPYELSVGVQKRISIARALVKRPKIILYDEPTTSVDSHAKGLIDDLIVKITHERLITSCVVTHELSSVRNIASHVTFLENGHILYDGSPNAFFACEQPDVRAFCEAYATV